MSAKLKNNEQKFYAGISKYVAVIYFFGYENYFLWSTFYEKWEYPDTGKWGIINIFIRLNVNNKFGGI